MPQKSKYWFALSGPAGTGKTTLMYEIVACLRELGIEAVGVTERVRLMPNFTHEELMKDTMLHIGLFAAQLKIQNELSVRSETQVIVLDRCLLDYYVLAQQSFPDYDWSSPVGGLKADLLKFDGFIIPSMLDISGDAVKVRPDDAFRNETARLFEYGMLEKYGVTEDKVYRLDNDTPLRDRCKESVNVILRSMGRSQIFRNWYTSKEIAKALRAGLGHINGAYPGRIWLGGSRCSISPTLPAFDSDYDFFFEGSADRLQEDVNAVEVLLMRMFGVQVSVTPITAELAEMVKLKELTD